VIDRDRRICSALSGRGRSWAGSCGPSGGSATVLCVYIATLICSDEACAEELDLVVEDPVALDDALCACDCTLVVLSVSEWARAELPALV
jgi:hypothetical protein